MPIQPFSAALKSLLDLYAQALADDHLGSAQNFADDIRILWRQEQPSDESMRELEMLLHPLEILTNFKDKTESETKALEDTRDLTNWIENQPEAFSNDAKIGAAVGELFLKEWRDKSLAEKKTNPFYISRTGGKPSLTLFPVWFGTNREPNDPTDFNQGFSHQRSNIIRYGHLNVAIPDNHLLGEIGNSWWQRWLRLEFRDDHLRLADTRALNETDFKQQLSKALALGEEVESSQVLVFLHGYNVSFEDAAIRAAQLGYDLKVPGPTAFFSWPSLGSLRGYPADAASIEASEAEIASFLCYLAQTCDPVKVHIISHSMGNRGLLRALQRITMNAETSAKVRFGQIFLAAPDVDRDLFLSLATLYQQFSERTTLYASRYDRAVWTSKWLHQAPRVGYLPPVTVSPYLDTVAVSNFDFDLLGHGYFAKQPGPLHDMFTLMRENLAPTYRQGLVAMQGENGGYWRFNI